MELPPKVPSHKFYHHYKHDPSKGIHDYAYEVVSVGFHTEDDCKPDEKWFVNYRPLYENAAVYKASKELGIECIDNRPLLMWMGDVTKGGKTFPRFQEITDPGVIAELEKVSQEMYS